MPVSGSISSGEAPLVAGPDQSGRMGGRRILLTGGASGIGRTTAELLLGHGASVAILDRDADLLASAARALDCFAIEADVTEESSVQRAVDQAAAALDGIDGVVNAAGIHLRGPIEEVAQQDFQRVLDVNLTGPYVVVRSCLPWLREAATASIVNIASAQGLRPSGGERSAYAASKGGLVTLSRALAAELAPAIRVNTICPGLVDTPMAAGVETTASTYALGRLAEPSEIANAILFLLSTESSYVTGAALAVDGGRSYH
jgi:NAD(P)-dependent dehydrogenase (short-subunit alcohol dehydrogenase family)